MDRGTMDIQHVNKAIAENYRKLRTRIGIVALAFPIIVSPLALESAEADAQRLLLCKGPYRRQD